MTANAANLQFVPINIHLICVSALLVLTACSSPRAHPKVERLRGTWQCESAVVDGKALPEQTVQQLRLTLTESRYQTRKGQELLFDSTYRLDPSAEPQQINMIGTEGELTGKEAQGIYWIEGEKLTICYTMPGKPRPTTFSSPAGSGAYLITWKRQRP